MIEIYLRAALGEPGWEILEFLRDHQLAVYGTIIAVYLAFRLYRRAAGRSSRKESP